MPKKSLGIVVPIYNVEKYIEDCLNSIVEAVSKIDEKNFVKVYLINDGSTDDSKKIAEKFVVAFPQMFFLTSQENGGVAKARNLGLSLVDSDYFTFIDPDDLISSDYFSEIFVLINSNEYDLITFDVSNFQSETNHFIEIFSGMDANELLSKWLVNGSLCSKIIKTDLVGDINFTDGLIYEDTEFVYKVLSKVSNYYYLEKSLYYYRIGRKNSITTNYKSNVDDIFNILTNIYTFYEDNSLLNNENKEGLEYQFVKILYWSNFYRQLKYARFNIFDGAKRMSETRKYLEHHFPNWMNNPLLNKSIYLHNLMGNNYQRLLPLIGCNIFTTYYVMLAYQVHKRRKGGS